MSNSKTIAEALSIFGKDEATTMRKRTLWLKANDERNKFLDGLRKEGLKRSVYSDAVVEYDKQHMQVFYV